LEGGLITKPRLGHVCAPILPLLEDLPKFAVQDDVGCQESKALSALGREDLSFRLRDVYRYLDLDNPNL
jgi:hypothetical protein